MIDFLPASLFRPLSELISQQLGLHFASDREADLQRAIASVAVDLGCADTDSCARELLSRPITEREMEVLARHLTVGETYFFRDKAAFKAFEEHVLPEMVRARRGRDQHIRIWSAACCSGEEAYSLAICVRRALPDFANWRVTIVGTDINRQFLQKADRGVFSEWSFRDTPPEFRESYFKRTHGGWEIRPEIRAMVTFRPLNLATDVYPPLEMRTQAADVIFCRNALIYFDSARAVQVIHDFARCLSESGWLVLGPNEISHVKSRAVVPVSFPGAVLHWKRPVNQHPPARQVEFAPPADFGPAFSPAKGDVSRDRVHKTVASAAAPQRSTLKSTKPLASIDDVRALANDGKLKAALATCDEVLLADKVNHVAHYLRAVILQELGELSDAGATLKRVLYLKPDFVLAHFALGNLSRLQGKESDSARHLENALTLANAHPSHEILPEADGLTAGHLAEMISALRAAPIIK